METVDVTFEGVRYCTNLSETYRAEDFYHMVYYASTGPVAFQHVIDIIVSGENDWWTSTGNKPVAHANFDSMSFNYKDIEMDLRSISPTPPELPRFTDALERAWSEGVEEQSKYMFADGAEGDDSSAFGDVMIGDLAAQEGREVNVITSKVNGRRKHKIVLDLDYDAALIPTSTPGHFHLLIDKDVDEDAYEDFLLACHNIGLIADGNLNQWSMHRRQFLRLPHVRKSKEKRPKEPAPAMGLVHPF